VQFEQWLGVVGLEDRYEVSDLGRVRNAKNGRIRKDQKVGTGYRSICFWVEGRRKPFYVHRLVLDAFVGPAPNLEADHLDGDKTNNKLINLRWLTRQQNCARRHEHGAATRGERSGSAKLKETQIRSIRSMPGSLDVLAAKFGVSRSLISLIKLRKVWVDVV
jgi:hypothetical protein